MNANRCTAVLRRLSLAALAIGFALLLNLMAIGQALATVTNDREYAFGDTGTSDPALGATVGEGNPLGFNFNSERRTADETGPPDTNPGDTIDDSGFRDLIVLKHPTGGVYADTSDRPLASAGEFGASFDGVDDILISTPLHIPSELALDFLPDYPINYTGIDVRGMQLWVRPSQAGIKAGVRQTIVMDTVRSGGVAITADGNWDQIFDNATADGEITATVPVVGDTWYHVMQHIHTSGEPGAPRLDPGSAGEAGFTAVVYVDGVAVSAINDSHLNDDGHTAGDRVGLLTVGGAEIADQDEDNTTSEYGEYFNGTVDDLDLYVFGDNTSEGGQDFGTFDLFSDNDWIDNEIATTVPGGVLQVGDVNRDGAVTIAGDVPAFVAGWLSENVLEGFGGELITVGDWNTWGRGDMNLDGRVDLRDWALINAASPAVGAAIDAALAGVPEPSTGALLAMAVGMAGAARRRRT